MKVGSLFSGIGGLDLGLEQAGMETVWQVEQSPYALEVLKRHWPNVPKYTDVREVGKHNLERVDLVAGGFPCQDISLAGSGEGLDGERSGLWREMYRIICELRPRYVLVENVAALLIRGIDRVLSDLSRSGYDAEWSVVSACSLGAPHVRRRLFIVAYTNSVNGRPRLWNTATRQNGKIQAVNSFESARADWQARLADPSELYRGANGLPFGRERNRAVGNAVAPPVARWIGERILEFDGQLQPCP